MDSNETITNAQNPVIITDKTNSNITNFIDKNRSFLQHIFPSNLQKILNLSDLTQAKTELEFREKALKMAKESQLHSIKEVYNDFLIRGKGEIRKDRAVFFSQKLEEMEVEIDAITDLFIEVIQKRYLKLDKISVLLLKQFTEKQIEKSIEGFYNSINKLRGDFQNILNEEIRS